MNDDRGPQAELITGERDPELNARLGRELDAVNFAATGVSDQGTLSVKAVDPDGDLVGLAERGTGSGCG